MKVTLASKDSTVCIKPKVMSMDMTKEQVNFLMTLESEVKKYPKQAKKLRKQIIATQAAYVSVLGLITPVSAATTTAPASQVDPDLLQTLIVIMGTCVVLAAASAVIALMAAGVWKMFFGERDSAEWTTNIVKGVIQVFSAPIIIALIAGMFTLLFSKLPAFQPIVAPLRAWYGG